MILARGAVVVHCRGLSGGVTYPETGKVALSMNIGMYLSPFIPPPPQGFACTGMPK